MSLLRQLLGTGAAVLLLVAIGCRQRAPTEPLIGVLSDTDQTPLRAWMRRHMEEAARRKGIRLLWTDQDERPPELSPAEWELIQLDRMWAAGIMALVYLPHDQSTPEEVFRVVREQGIPLVLLDRVPPNLRPDALVWSDFREAGRQAALEALNAVRRWGRYNADHAVNALVVEGSPRRLEERQTTKGFYDVLDEVPNVRVVAAEPVEDPTQAFQLVSRVLNDYAGNVQLLLIASTEYVGGALLAAQTHGAADWIVSAGVGAGLEACRLILQGVHDFEVDRMPGERAAMAVEIARRMAAGEPISPHGTFVNGRVQVPVFYGPLRILSRQKRCLGRRSLAEPLSSVVSLPFNWQD
ncbi:MAG: hypothetical protein KatS3mg115_0977 [Candidatus Poribacteria bacterium]|nr:MAG: hypothetical protein KatS3mg115_0977 [Candidatus Poribacteria bacterium]